MTVELTPDQARIVREQLTAGHYETAEQVLTAALLLLAQQIASQDIDLTPFNEELERRIAALDRGEFLTPEQLRENLDRRRAERFAQSA